MIKIHGQFSKKEIKWPLGILKDAQLYLQLQKCKSIHRAAVTETLKTRHFGMPVAAVQIGTNLWRAHFSDSAVPIQECIRADTHKRMLFAKHYKEWKNLNIHR